MSSQTDYDQGGSSRQLVRTYMGPTVGWVMLPGHVPLNNIVAPGTYSLQPNVNLVTVSVAGAVTIILPTAINPASPAVNQSALWAKAPVTIVDVGGFAGANPITIKPISGAETIMSLTQIQITSNFGAFTLAPSNSLAGWVNANQ
jgi:hypothetical protein